MPVILFNSFAARLKTEDMQRDLFLHVRLFAVDSVCKCVYNNREKRRVIAKELTGYFYLYIHVVVLKKWDDFVFLERLIQGISQVKNMLSVKATEPLNPESQEELTRQLEKCCKLATSEYIFQLCFFISIFI